MSGDNGQPCLVPELTAKSLADVVPLAWTFALMWFSLYTVARRDLNLLG
jgi:hypothetical protein